MAFEAVVAKCDDITSTIMKISASKRPLILTDVYFLFIGTMDDGQNVLYLFLLVHCQSLYTSTMDGLTQVHKLQYFYGFRKIRRILVDSPFCANEKMSNS